MSVPCAHEYVVFAGTDDCPVHVVPDNVDPVGHVYEEIEAGDVLLLMQSVPDKVPAGHQYDTEAGLVVVRTQYCPCSVPCVQE